MGEIDSANSDQGFFDRLTANNGKAWLAGAGLIAIGLVIGVTFLFLGQWRPALIPAVPVPVSLVGTLAVMYLCGFPLHNLSLMALKIATGLCAADAILVLENTTRPLAIARAKLLRLAHRGGGGGGRPVSGWIHFPGKRAANSAGGGKSHGRGASNRYPHPCDRNAGGHAGTCS